jgi:MFS family permease
MLNFTLQDFIMTIPLGFLAQRYGRRLVLNLNICSRLFMIGWAVVVGSFEALLPTKAVIAGPVLSFLGGDCVFNSVIYALASDLTDDAVRRAIYFGYISSISYVVALLGPAMASTTMSLLLWLPFYLGMAVLGLALVIVPVVAPSHRVSRARHGAHQEEDEQRRGLLSSPILKAQDARRGTFIFRSVVDHIYTLVAIVASHPWNFSLLLFSFFLTSLASADTKLLVQYISAKYQWTFASAGYLISGKAVVNFALLTLVIPWFLRTRRLDDVNSVDQANVRYAKYCLVVSVLGALGIAAAVEFWALVPSLVVYALGSALPIFTLSLLKSTQFCPQNSEDNNAPNASGADNHVFSIVMLVKTMGSLLGAPLMAALWVRGIDIGGLALGFPYFVSALCYAMAMLVFSAIRLN